MPRQQVIPSLRILSGIFFVVLLSFDSLSLNSVQSLFCPLLNAQSEPIRVVNNASKVYISLFIYPTISIDPMPMSETVLMVAILRCLATGFNLP